MSLSMKELRKLNLLKSRPGIKLNDWEEDIEFNEYCLPTKKYKTLISVIWEA